MSDSDLVITGIDLPPYALRGVSQTLEPISGSSVQRRTINGTLVNVASSVMKKYRSTISGNDQQPPALNGIFPGDTVTVDCVAELAYKTAGGSADRTVVSGSSRTDGDYTFYRPQLTMILVNYNVQRDELNDTVSWSMELEEV